MRFYGIAISLFVFYSVLCAQRKVDIKVKGAGPVYLPVSTSGLADCNFFNTGLKLAFSEEFNSTVIDTTIWRLRYPWGQANSDSSDAWCDPGQVLLTGNTVKLGCEKNTNTVVLDGQSTDRGYGIGAISSKQKFGYGYYEIRCKIPRIAELWPAFWLFGDCSQEIDIFEFEGSHCKSSKKEAFHDPLWACDPFRPRWYIPQECASANPIMSYHSPKSAESQCLNNPGEARTVERTLEFSSWDVSTTPFNPNKGCVYDNIEVDVDFHADWHTFSVYFAPDVITWFIDSIPQFSECRFFIHNEQALPVYGTRDEYNPVCLGDYCSGHLEETLYEQVNFPRGGINMGIIVNNNHKSLTNYNHPRWVDDYPGWSDGYFEIDYIRYYQFTNSNAGPYFCKSASPSSNDFDLYPNPAHDAITVSTTNTFIKRELKITDMFGNELSDTFFYSRTHRQSLNLEPGMYFLIMIAQGKSTCKKLVIE